MNFATLVSSFRRRTGAPLLFGLVASLAACGGGDDSDESASQATVQTAGIVSPLVENEGFPSVSDPRAWPEDPAARSDSGRYATAAQARMLSEALGEDILDIEVDCCGAQAVDNAVGLAWGLQAARDLPNDTPVLVRGADLRMAAAAANRLASGGLTHVWLVAQ
jgi:hypothetical protein